MDMFSKHYEFILISYVPIDIVCGHTEIKVHQQTFLQDSKPKRGNVPSWAHNMMTMFQLKHKHLPSWNTNHIRVNIPAQMRN